MRKYLIVGLIAIFGSCDNEEEGYKISGTVQNAQEGQVIYVSELNDTNTQAVTVDTITIENGKFELDLPDKDSPTISFLSLEGTRGNVLYIAENDPITFTVYPDSLFTSKVEGGKENEVLYDYLGQARDISERMGEAQTAMRDAFTTRDSTTIISLQDTQKQIIDEDKANKKRLVEENPNLLVSVMVLQDMVNNQQTSASELRQLFDQLSPELKEVPLAKTLDQSIKKMSRTDVGSVAPNFSAPTPQGEELALEDALGKVTLLDFWAAWCKPCRDENPNIVDVYNKYHDQGFNIIQVSLDRPGQKDKWVQAIEQDNLGQWNHVSNLMFWQDPIAVEYGIRAIPAAFLLDEQGKIVAKNLRGEELGIKVGELLGN